MSDTADSTLKILISVQGQLDDLLKAQAEMRRMRIETAAAGQAIKSGFSGLFGSIFGANLAVNAVSKAVSFGLNQITSSISEANQTFERSKNLDVGLDGYVRLQKIIKQSGGDVGALDQAIERMNRSFSEIGKGQGKEELQAFRNLGLDPIELRTMDVDERFLRLGRAAMQSKDQLAAWGDVATIIGDRTLRPLRGGLIELAENGFGSITRSAAEAEARGTSAIHSFFDSLDQAKGTFKSKVVEDFGGFLTLFGYGSEISRPKEISAADVSRLTTVQHQRDLLKALRVDMATLQAQTDSYVNSPAFTDADKRFFANDAAQRLVTMLQMLQKLRSVMPLDGQDQADRDAEIAAIGYQIDGLNNSLRGGPGRFAQSQARYQAMNQPTTASVEGNPNYLSAAQGFSAGPMEWATQIGSVGEQIAAGLNATIGDAVHGISDGIYGWVTGANNFGQVVMNLGSSVLRTLIDSVVQMGVQWVITGGLAKATLAGIHLLGSMLRGKETAEVIAAETAKKPALVSNAAAANAGSFGMSALIGIAILTALMAAFGGFEAGGYTGDVPTNMIAGVVHGQEGVLNASAMRRFGVDNLNRINAGLPLNPSSAMAFGGEGANGFSGGRESARNIHVYLDRSAWLDAVRQDLGGLAHEIYDKRARS